MVGLPPSAEATPADTTAVPGQRDRAEPVSIPTTEQTTARVNIAICTYARQQLLAACLHSLDELRLPAQVEVIVSVIDNSADESARVVVENQRCTSRFTIDYVTEPRRGIPFARNRAIDHALEHNIDHLIFIDDDEYVSPQWLVELVAFSRAKRGEAIISGEVRSVVPGGVPDDISHLFTRERGARTGAQLDTCATNNVLIPMHLIRRHGLRFDESRPLAGGTDTMFFVTAALRGIEIYKCREALVYETVPLSRANLRWLSQRKYRAGVTDAWRKRQNGRSGTSIMASSLQQIVMQLLICTTTTVANRKGLRNRAWLRICKSTGTLMGLLGHRVDSYHEIDK